MRKGQIWIETVLYTLIGISLIALVVAFITPKINESRDRALVQQTIDSLNVIDEKINSVTRAAGNVRPVDLLMKRGEFFIDSANDRLVFVIDGITKPYSEPGVDIRIGRITLLSSQGKKSNVTLSINYGESINITYSGNDEIEARKFGAAAVPYKLLLESKGTSNDRYVVNIEENSGR